MSFERLKVRDLCIEASEGYSKKVLINSLDLDLVSGETIGLVGVSGSGKTLLLKALAGLVAEFGYVVKGVVELWVDGQVYTIGKNTAMNPPSRVNSRVKRYPFYSKNFTREGVPSFCRYPVGWLPQSGIAALNPYLSIKTHLDSFTRRCCTTNHARKIRGKFEVWLRYFKFSEPRRILDKYPHQLSGGMAQRVLLSIVLSFEPSVLLLDEVMTGLDVGLQTEIISALRLYREKHKSLIILSSHSIEVVGSLIERWVVLEKGKIVETLWSAEKRDSFQHPYSIQLFMTPKNVSSAVSSERHGTKSSVAIAQFIRVRKQYSNPCFFGDAKAYDALVDVSLKVFEGESLGVVGSSGSGKTTLAKVMAGFLGVTTGEMWLFGHMVSRSGSRSCLLPKSLRYKVRYMHQNGYTGLNPKISVINFIAEGLQLKKIYESQSMEVACGLLEEAGLLSFKNMPLGSLSGGEKRIVGLLRVLNSGGRLIILDEPSTGLDAISRQKVIEKIRRFQEQEIDVTFVVISHDLKLVKQTTDRTIVLEQGRIIENIPFATSS